MTEKMTVSSGNVFEDLGFDPDEAAAMHARESLLIALEKNCASAARSNENLPKNLGCHEPGSPKG